MSVEPSCEYLEWDSNFFGKRIARVTESKLTERGIADIEKWCDEWQIDCLYCLINSADTATVELAEKSKFHLVDVRLTLATQLQEGPSLMNGCVDVRTFVEPDLPELQGIARSSHRDSRFYHDRNFPQDLCDRFFETWIEKSCHGWAKVVFVAGNPGMPDGYITCHLNGPNIGQIGLVAVGAQSRGKGLGDRLIRQSLSWFKEQGVGSVEVVTQARNVRAQRLYQRAGFVTKSADLWFHRWFMRRMYV